MASDFMALEDEIVRMLKTVYDPEIPVNVYDLGLIYGVETDDDKNVAITMTLTAPGCPMVDFLVEDVKMKVESIPEVKKVDVTIVFEPEWHQGLMSEEAKLELGFL
ncbi:Fe-S assembly SUF system protein [Bacteroidia bacterium]|nr:Fe-S assembly SUF system protein [Bacteroidia bacterium]GHT38292.1 Fe-S assembly SUF system protein [Bacteroidia bacterium]